jgi:alpha-aminoadipic semialdehyde synthase
MAVTIGIRRENKNEWERRVPLIPVDLKALNRHHGIDFLVQPSRIRIYKDDEYRQVGAVLQEDLDPASIVLAVKEIPERFLKPGRVYVFFAHVIKGQAYNMSMLRRLMELGCSLVDYETVVDEKGRRLIFFGVHAGYAGMFETLRCLGRRLESKGIPTPLAEVKHAYQYDRLEDAETHLREIGERIRRGEIEERLRPLVIGIAGYGNVSRGAQEILDFLPVEEISVADLPKAAQRRGAESPPILKVVFKEEDMVRPARAGMEFKLLDYYQNPEKYTGCFEEYLPHLDVLVNTIYWDDRYPRLVTKEWAKRHYGPGGEPRLQVIGDISCDVEGAIELTLRPATPDAPDFVYDPHHDVVRPGYEGSGPAIMAVDNLPCEFSRESSEYFSEVLHELLVPLASADWSAEFSRLRLPKPLKDAVIVHRGKLTPSYGHLEEYLKS